MHGAVPRCHMGVHHHGVPMGRAWAVGYVHGLCMDCVWDVHGTCMGRAWLQAFLPVESAPAADGSSEVVVGAR